MTLSFSELTPCVYCGAIADSIDHVPPSSVRLALQAQDPLQKRWPFKTVDSCRECNSVLSDIALWTVSERKRHIKTRLRQRYDKLLKMPDWDEDEMEDMSEKMQQHIRDGLRKREFIRQRIAH